MPVCPWGIYNNDILRRIMERYPPARGAQAGSVQAVTAKSGAAEKVSF
jgi:hypothetical protein